MKEETINLLAKIASKFGVKRFDLISEYRDGYVGKKRFKVTLNDGTQKYCDQITKGGRNGDAVMIIPVTPENQFVVIMESRPLSKSGVILEFPAGMVDEGEERIDAALRELKEETGYVPDKMIPLEWHYQDQGCSKAIVSSYVALGCTKRFDKDLDESERIESVLLDYDEIKEELLDNDSDNFKDANSKIAFLEYTMRKGR